MILETSRSSLRPFTESDLDRMAQLFANRDFMRFSMGPKTPERTRSLLDKWIGCERSGQPSPFAMVGGKTGTVMGYCGFLHQQVDGKAEIEIGYRLNPAFWNRGFATEAARAVRDHAFRDLKLERVISLIHPQNHASRRVTEKNGMHLEKQTAFRGFPTLVFTITRSQWLELAHDAE